MLEAAIHERPPAIVAKADTAHREAFLKLMGAGEPVWISDPAEATRFASMREAMRMAMRLPGALRAYGLPASPRLASERLH
jgi:hypothetical protein